MNVYAESSAVLAWLLDEPPADAVEQAFAGAEMVLASELTLVECDRALVWAQVTGRFSEDDVNQRRALLEAISAAWSMVELGKVVLERARWRFPAEPLRTLDALHVASALAARSAVPDLALLSLDRQVRENGAALGFQLVPAEAGSMDL